MTHKKFHLLCNPIIRCKSIDISMTVHNYKKKTKQWSIECNWRKEL